MPIANRSPFPPDENPPAEPAAISATPANVTAAPIQNGRARCSRPSASVVSPMKTGVVPSSSATVDACAYFSPYTKQIWLRKISDDASPTSQKSRRSIQNERSR